LELTELGIEVFKSSNLKSKRRSLEWKNRAEGGTHEKIIGGSEHAKGERENTQDKIRDTGYQKR